MNCFLKGDKAETVRKPKYVSGSISKVLYHSYHVSKLNFVGSYSKVQLVMINDHQS